MNDLAQLISADVTAASWRIPCREAGVLEFFLEIIDTEEVDFDLSSQTLRLIGNACADTGLLNAFPASFIVLMFLILWQDSNRESVVSQEVLPSIINNLENDGLAKLVVPVLYNICVDYGEDYCYSR